MLWCGTRVVCDVEQCSVRGNWKENKARIGNKIGTFSAIE